MVTATNPFESEADQNQSGSSSQQSNPSTSSPQINSGVGGATVGASQGAGPASPANTLPTSSGRYTSLQKYIDANKDFNSEGGGLAGSVINNINSQASGVQSGIQNAETDYNNKAQAQENQWKGIFNLAPPNLQPTQAPASSSPSAAPAAVSNSGSSSGYTKNPDGSAPPTASQDVTGIMQTPAAPTTPTVDTGPAGSLLNAAVYNPDAVVKNQDALNSVLSARDAQYTGPKSLMDLAGQDNYNALNTQASNVQSLVNSGQTEGGRFDLLRTMFGNSNYSRGQQSLDNLIMQSNPDQFGKLQQAQTVASGLNRSLADAQNQTQLSTAHLQNEAQDISAQTRAALAAGVKNEVQNVQGELTGANSAQDKAIQNFLDLYNRGYMSSSDMARLGLKAGDSIYNTTVTPDEISKTQLNQYNVATPEDIAKFQALNTLVGNTADPDTSASLQSFIQNAAQAGAGTKGPLYNVNTQALQNAIQSAKQSYTDQSTPLVGAIGQAQTQLNNLNAYLNSGQTQLDPFQHDHLVNYQNIMSKPEALRTPQEQADLNFLLTNLQGEQNKLASNQSALTNLQKLMNYGKTLQVYTPDSNVASAPTAGNDAFA